MAMGKAQRGSQVTADPEHIKMSAASSIEVEIRLTDKTVLFATIVRRSILDVVVRVWGLRRLRRIAIADIRLLEPVHGLSWIEYSIIRDAQAKGIPLPARHRKKHRRTHRAAVDST
jgi:hypothetical protein